MNVHIRRIRHISRFGMSVFLSLCFCGIPNLRSEETPEEELKRLLSLRETFLSEYRNQGAKIFDLRSIISCGPGPLRMSKSEFKRFLRKKHLFFPVCWANSPFYQTGGLYFEQGDITYYIVRWNTKAHRAAKNVKVKQIFDMPDAFFPMSYMEKKKNGPHIYVLLVEKCELIKLKDFYWSNIFPLLDDRIGTLRRQIDNALALTTELQDPAQRSSAEAASQVPAEIKTPVSRKKVITLPGDVKLEMIKVNAGTFTMGSPLSEEGRDRDEQQHEVTITEDYWIGRYEVTQAQYEAVMGNNPSEDAGTYYPVTNVSYNDAVAFCEKLNSLTEGQRPRNHIYALPTEAQWEFAARGGIYGKTYCVYSGGDDIADVAWFKGNASSVHMVGDKQPNELGLYDMSGNVWEWVRDVYKPYTENPEVDPDHQDGNLHISRGGGFLWHSAGCRSASRNKDQKVRRDCGFRLALVRTSSAPSDMTWMHDAGSGQMPAGGHEPSEDGTKGSDPGPVPGGSGAENSVEESKTRLNQALIYLKRGGADDKEKAAKYMQMAAESGLDEAQWLLGLFYQTGVGVEKDPSQAAVWFQKAADQGHVKALKSLAGCYYQGLGVQKNTEEAIRLFEKAADGNNADAQYILGCCYAAGTGVEKDFEKARFWLERAAENGHKKAKEKLLDLTGKE